MPPIVILLIFHGKTEKSSLGLRAPPCWKPTFGLQDPDEALDVAKGGLPVGTRSRCVRSAVTFVGHAVGVGVARVGHGQRLAAPDGRRQGAVVAVPGLPDVVQNDWPSSIPAVRPRWRCQAKTHLR